MYSPSRKSKRRGKFGSGEEGEGKEVREKKNIPTKAYTAQFLQAIRKNKYSHHSCQGQAPSTGTWPVGRWRECLEAKIPFSAWDVYQILHYSELHQWKHLPKYLCPLLLTSTVRAQLDDTPQEIIPSERKKKKKNRITSRKDYPLACFHLVQSTEKSGKR